MEIKIEKLPLSEQKITVILSAEKQESLKAKAIEKLSQKIKLAGFRQGKAPLSLVEKQLGEATINNQIIEANLPLLYAEAIQKEKLTPISRPSVEIITESPLSFSATFAVQPEITIKDLDKIKIAKPEIKVTKKELDESIETMLKSYATFKEVDRKSKSGDRVELNFEGVDEEGTSIPGAKSQNHPLELGSNTFIPGFEDNVIGLTKGESKEFIVTFPKDYHEVSLQNKPVTFKIEVTKVEEKELPKIDKEFSKKVLGEELDEAGFKAKIEHELEHQKIHDAQSKQEEDLFEKLLKEAKFEVSPILTKEETENLLNEMKENMERQGLTYENFVKITETKEGKSVEEVYASKGEERVKIRFIIDYVIKEKSLEATDEDYENSVKEQIDKAPKEIQAQVKEYYQKDKPGYKALRNKILLDKFFNLFIDPIDHDC